MNDSTRIITFYSYKGGVGRSMAVMNVAYDLAAKGARVLVLDMDLEAPGLSGFLRRDKKIGRFPQRDMVDLVAWAKNCYDTSATGSSHVDSAAFPPGSEFTAGVNKADIANPPRDPYLLGCIDIVPADEVRDYCRRLNELGVNKFDQRALIGVGSILRAWLQAQEAEVDVPEYYGPHAERKAKHDFVLIDSRTGLSETGGLCIGPLSDELVVLTSLNDQNVEGTRHFLEEVGILERRPAVPENNGREHLAKAKRLDPKPTMIVAEPGARGRNSNENGAVAGIRRNDRASCHTALLPPADGPSRIGVFARLSGRIPHQGVRNASDPHSWRCRTGYRGCVLSRF